MMYHSLTALMLLLLSVSLTQAVFTPTSWTELKTAVNAYVDDGDTNTNGEISEWDVSNVTDMHLMFWKASSFNADISNWDVSKVTNMEGMFIHAKSFNVDISNWDVSKVTDMSGMFYYAESFNGDINHWDVSNVEDMRGMFIHASSFDKDLCWDISNVVYSAKMLDESPGQLDNYPECRFLNNPFRIISGLSTDNEKWCIYPVNNFLAPDTKIVLSECKEWRSFNWVIDHEGKIKNYKDPSLCIHMHGGRMMIRTCVDGLRNQKWRYSTQKRLTTKNGIKGALVEDGIPVENGLVKYLEYIKDNATGSEMWSFEYTFGTLSVPSYNTFRIVANQSTETNMWCIYPAGNVVDDGMKMVISSCKDWKTYKWTIDSQGKIHNVKDPEKCITRLGKRLQINNCTDNNKFQRWVYNVIDKKLSALVNGQVQATMIQKKAAPNIEVRGFKSVEPGPSHQKWEFEEI